MRPLVLLLLACLAFVTPSLRAQSTDPGDLFVNAYMAVQAGDKAEAAGNFREANSKYRYAAQILEQISDKFPSWQPSIVEYRKKRTAEAITRIQEKVGRFGGAKTGTPPPTMSDKPLPPVAGDPSALFPPPDILPNTPTPRAGTGRTQPDRRATEPELPSRNPIQELDERMKRLERDLSQAREEAEKAQKEKADLAKQLEQANEAKTAAEKRRELLEQRSRAAEEALVKATAEGKTGDDTTKLLAAELAETKKQLRDLKLEGDAETEFRQQLNDRLRSAQKKIATLNEQKVAAEKATSDVPTRIADIQKQLDQAQKEKKELTTRLTKTETDLKQALEQRDEALAQVTKMREAQKQVDKLISDNASLMTRLSEAEKTITLTKADGVKKDQEIAALRKETGSLREQLAQAQKESGDYQRQMATLQQKLTEANTQISQMKTDNTKSVAERNRLQEENQILRGVVLRQQKEEARRAQTKKLVLVELAKMEGKSKVLMDQVEYLSGPVVKLSAKERALFKKPELQISDTEISITAARSDELPTADVPPAEPASAPLAKAEEKAPAPPDSAGPEVKLPVASATKSNQETAPEIPKTAATEKPADPAKTTAPMPPTAGETKPSLSLETGAKSELELASNKQPAPSLSSLPDGLKPIDRTEKKPASAAEDLPAKAPDTKGAEKPTTGAATSSEPASGTSGSGGTGSSSGVAMNLPADLVPQAREGKDQFERGNYREAEKIYERILTKAPNNLYTLSNLGVVYFRSGKFKRAEEMFKKALAIAPEDGFSHCTLGIVYYSQQKYDDAVNELTKALAVNPKNATAHNYLGITASQKGWQEAAQKELEMAVTLDPTYADAHFNLAVIFATQQPPNKENARKYYKRATELGAEPDTALEQLIK